MIPKAFRRLVKELLSLHAFLSPILFPPALLYDSYRGAETAVPPGVTLVLRKLGFGLLGALHVWLVLTALMGVAVALGFGMVHLWVGEPVVLRDTLYFDYTQANPKALLSFGIASGIPVGHNFHVSFLLLMPDSPYNRQLGVFQVTAEILSSKGDVMVRSSQPCMLRFRSGPVRLARALVMAVPLALGLSDETQKMQLVRVLKHRERIPRSGGIRVTMSPRAGTRDVPQLYEAKMVVKSELPWTKEVVRRWKWTACVWTTIYLYLTLLMVLGCWLRAALLCPLLFVAAAAPRSGDDDIYTEDLGGAEAMAMKLQVRRPSSASALSASEVMRRMQQRRRKRKAAIILDVEETESCSSTVASGAEEQGQAGNSESVFSATSQVTEEDAPSA